MAARIDNETGRQAWLSKTLGALPNKARLLDAGAGELRNRVHCEHLDYVSQDFNQYAGTGDGKGLQTGVWDTSRIDLVSDITAIPAPDASFDYILCSEVFEHIPEPLKALDEFWRLLRPGGKIITTAPFVSLTHFAPYHFGTGFSRYWYEHHLPLKGFQIEELTPNGDWYALCQQEMRRLGGMERAKGVWSWPLAYALRLLGDAYFAIRPQVPDPELACFSWFCVATKTDRHDEGPMDSISSRQSST